MQINSILLVEDDDLDVISIQRSLRKIDMENKLHTAFNGVEALAMLRGEGKVKIDPLPDVILLDLNMPKMNGIEFLTQLRNDSKFKDIKVFIMTTSNESPDRIAAKNLGISGYIIKPLNFNDNTKNNSSMDNFMHFQILKILNQQ
jgi:CheY-like chemotaxis protein